MKQEKGFQLNFFNKFLLFFNGVFLLMAYSVYLNRFFAPSEIPYFNFISIGYPFIFLVACLFVGYWLIVSWRYALIVLVASFGVLNIFTYSYPIGLFQKKSTAKPNLSVMSYNAHFIRDDGTDQFIAKNLADIMMFQEAYEKNFKSIEKELQSYYSEHYGLIAFFSKYPIIETKQINFPTQNNKGTAAYADIDTGKDTIRLVNIYMETMGVDKNLVKSTIEAENSAQVEEKTKKIENKLIAGMLMHEKQLKEIMPYITKSPYPVLVGCDLNATPASYEYQQLNAYLYDSFLQVGKGNATTFHGFRFPIRIDYLFHSKEFIPIDGKIIRKKFSDHYPVIVQYQLP
ncbi:endonuclease/exonuclease/phosphatase family protein [Weeksella virosa]|uniref:Endonuclease/exonuclease/phosphatase n=1 Tax=Weeksella virosa (strain ATCC 43766 / DSM 16922 / JCM 21250 / CCUG 30538 / CDC 9751 / IAM 14551 / NBRC 16016 / NCTC 11634 / CL345/78) TaxID=865938 RepID=F0NYD7_WEEVC|nr:endonuclease/exonuclease/phosphatase family protein [Weeksella virosa]ADX68134.1 Endonuclease/exonuclease/phosphatase [Weeksella virosa DSM 16922]VEH64231.1 Uncharacterized protein conserved in bacteria [Weeksella virosa]